MQHHNYSLSDLENMLPWEKDIYVDMLISISRKKTKKKRQDNKRGNKMSEEKIVVPSDKKEVSKKVAVELEVDTSIKDFGTEWANPYAKIIHMARAVDSWRIFPRIFITTYIILLYKCVIW